MSLVVDSSVAVKWVVAEDGRQSALELPDVAALLAPDFVLVESANVMWKKVRRGQMTAEQMADGLMFIRDAFQTLVPQAELVNRAAQLAVAFDHPVYDCLYLACAESRNAELLTADKALATKFSGHKIKLLEASR